MAPLYLVKSVSVSASSVKDKVNNVFVGGKLLFIHICAIGAEVGGVEDVALYSVFQIIKSVVGVGQNFGNAVGSGPLPLQLIDGVM